MSERLIVSKVMVPNKTSPNPSGTDVYLNDGNRLGNVKEVKVIGSVDDGWKVRVVIESYVMNTDLPEFFQVKEG
ncbi:TPA: hypothetical protein NU718_000380 [Acinetobacter baumannii]|nr:hypothetical protein [Acinetobacter baumannii]